MNTITKRRRAAAIAASTLAAALGLTFAAMNAGPAEAQVLDTDHPHVTANNHDFGKNWALGAPVNGGDLTWDLTNGVTTVTLEGYHYLADHHCGRVFVEYFNDAHQSLGTDSSSTVCAPGNGKTQWWITESFSSTTVTHVHVSVQHHNSNGTYTTVDTDTEDFD